MAPLLRICLGSGLIVLLSACGGDPPPDPATPGASGSAPPAKAGAPAGTGAAGAGSVASAPAPAPKVIKKRKRTGAMFVTDLDITLKVQMDADAKRKGFALQNETDAKGAPIEVSKTDGCNAGGVEVDCPAAYDDPAWDNCPDGKLQAVDAGECYCEQKPKDGNKRVWRNACPKKLKGK